MKKLNKHKILSAACIAALPLLVVACLEFDGIILEGSGSCALRIAASDNIVKNCIVRFSEAGIKVDGYRNVIDNNDIYHIGAT